MHRSARTSLVAAAVAAVTAAATVGLVAAPAEAKHSRTSTYTLQDGAGQNATGVFPEGIAVEDGAFYTGSTATGTIYRGDLRGSTAIPFLPGGVDGRTSAVGLKADDGLLFVAGGATGRFFIYDLDTRALVGSFQVTPAPDATRPTFLNDATVAKDGSVYITDSVRPVLYRIAPDAYATGGTVAPLPVFLDFTGSALTYQAGFNVNGIASSSRHQLVLAQSNTRKLYRVDTRSKIVSEIDLGGGAVAGDGLVLKGRTLYAVERRGEVGYVVEIRLSQRLTRGRIVDEVTDPTFDDPTTAALSSGRLLVVNSQFGERGGVGTLDPFTVSSIKKP